ncbi:MAG: transglycosylase domain-containing protein [Clostridia bacterium]|nr:transglycosylase domain-containing protein [Clostridia bacterium]
MNNYFDNEYEDISSKSQETLDLNSFSSKETSNKSKRKKSSIAKKQQVFKTLLTLFLVGVIVVSVVVSVFLVYAFTSVDGTMTENLDELKLNFTTTIYTKNKNNEEFSEYQRLHGEFNRIWVGYDPQLAKSKSEEYYGIPQNLVNAFVAIEDKRFYSHYGVDWKRTASAFANMFLHFYSSNQGGSTITQQLVKNLTSDNEQKASRKIREIMRARYLESHYAKDTIIECYLNTIAMGHGLYGVGVASNYYFDKEVKDLTIAECATLAAITKSPSYYAPDDQPENNKIRKETVLSEMLSQNLITEEEYNNALTEEVKIIADKDNLNETDINSYFVDALIRQVTKDIAKKYNYDESHAASLFYNGGYKIYSTLDPSIQKSVEKTFNDAEKYGIKGRDGKKLQGSFTIMDYKGHVLGMAGGIGKKTVNLGMSGFNRATDAVRQPGSTMKPIAAYAPSIENNLINYSSIVNDKKTNYGKWKPVNWYKGYWGNITVQYALERSVNTIPVYLVNLMSPQASFDFLTQKLGITTLTNEDVNLSPLGMGGTNGGLTTLESAAAYAIFGNGGLYYQPKLYYKVLDQHDNVVLDAENEPTIAISEDTATVMNRLLQGVVYGSNGTGRGASGYIPNLRIYAKTGTSNDSKDLWFVGGTPYYVASCWCGYDKQQDIPQSTIALKMWGAVMSEVHKGLKSKSFDTSDYAVPYYYCRSSGQLATSSCPNKALGWYRQSGIPQVCKTHSGTAVSKPEISSDNSTVKKQTKKKATESNKATSTTEN